MRRFHIASSHDEYLRSHARSVAARATAERATTPEGTPNGGPALALAPAHGGRAVGALRSVDVIGLQQTHGNRAVQRLLADHPRMQRWQTGHSPASNQRPTLLGGHRRQASTSSRPSPLGTHRQQMSPAQLQTGLSLVQASLGMVQSALGAANQALSRSRTPGPAGAIGLLQGIEQVASSVRGAQSLLAQGSAMIAGVQTADATSSRLLIDGQRRLAQVQRLLDQIAPPLDPLRAMARAHLARTNAMAATPGLGGPFSGQAMLNQVVSRLGAVVSEFGVGVSLIASIKPAPQAISAPAPTLGYPASAEQKAAKDDEKQPEVDERGYLSHL